MEIYTATLGIIFLLLSHFCAYLCGRKRERERQQHLRKLFPLSGPRAYYLKRI